jgi:hypothetical protein
LSLEYFYGESALNFTKSNFLFNHVKLLTHCDKGLDTRKNMVYFKEREGKGREKKEKEGKGRQGGEEGRKGQLERRLIKRFL